MNKSFYKLIVVIVLLIGLSVIFVPPVSAAGATPFCSDGLITAACKCIDVVYTSGYCCGGDHYATIPNTDAVCGASCTVCASGTSCSSGHCCASTPVTLHWNSGLGKCVQCATGDNSCGSGTYCNTSTNLCSCGANTAWVNGVGCSCNSGYLDCNNDSTNNVYNNGCEVNKNTDNNNCGSCGNTCTNGKTCQSGSCQCPSGTAWNGASCVDSCRNNADCHNGYICDNWGGSIFGNNYCACQNYFYYYDPILNKTVKDATKYAGYQTCTTSCGEGCSTPLQCVNTLSDTNNCGFCGNKCATGLSCVSGICQCPTGTTLCSGKCIDTANNAYNCGKCGNACPTTSHICSGGTCVQCTKDINCPPGQVCSASNTCITPCTNVNGLYGSFCGNEFDVKHPPNYPNTEWDVKYDCTGSCYLCLDPYKNCNNRIIDGCEINTQTDNNNCGICENNCTAQSKPPDTCIDYKTLITFPQKTCQSGTCNTIGNPTTCQNSQQFCNGTTQTCTALGICSNNTCTTSKPQCETCPATQCQNPVCGANNQNGVCTTTNKTDGTNCTITTTNDGTCKAGVCTPITKTCNVAQCVNYNQTTCSACTSVCSWDSINAHCCGLNQYWDGSQCQTKRLCSPVHYYDTTQNICCWSISGYNQWDSLSNHVTQY